MNIHFADVIRSQIAVRLIRETIRRTGIVSRLGAKRDDASRRTRGPGTAGRSGRIQA